MAEAIALVANIFQFVEYGSKLTQQVWSLYSSLRDGRKAPLEVSALSADLMRISKSFQQSKDPSSPRDGLSKLAADCVEASDQLRDLITSLNISSGPAAKKDAMKGALKFVWKEDQIKGLQDRMEKLKDRLMFQMVEVLRQESMKSLKQQEQILARLDYLVQTSDKEQSRSTLGTGDLGLGTVLLNFVTSKVASPDTEKKERNHLLDQWREQLRTCIINNELPELDHRQRPIISNEREQVLLRTVLSQLHYEGMDDRQYRIATAHLKTYRWLFEDDASHKVKSTGFQKWLSSESQLYWITGKPGSGKSTLMKYICQPSSEDGDVPRYVPYLREWAQDLELKTATFYFWNSGSDMQMKRAGFLRSILHQLFSALPEMVPLASPKQWAALCLLDDVKPSWILPELETMLLSTLKHTCARYKICFFIDGLDELDRDHQGFASFLRLMLTYRNVKMCVASRPWVVFEDAFQQAPSLMLQHLTFGDIMAYSSSTLHSDPNFALLQSQEPEYAGKLVENIATKAAGVFLWATFVTKSLAAGIGYGDRVVDLERRLETMPPDLEHLYEKILASLDPFYLEHAAQLFDLVGLCSKPPSLLFLSFADEPSLYAALTRDVGPMETQEADRRREAMRRRLNSRTKGFLEAPLPPTDSSHETGLVEPTVQYLHRTVKDFIATERVQTLFKSKLNSEFDAQLKFCAATLSSLKIMDIESSCLEDVDNWLEMAKPAEEGFPSLYPLWQLVAGCLDHAAKALRRNDTQTVALMDELDRTVSTFAKTAASSVPAPPLLVDQLELGPKDHINTIKAALTDGRWAMSFAKMAPVLYYDFTVCQFTSHKARPWDSVSKPKWSRAQAFAGHFISIAVRFNVISYVEARAIQGCLVTRPTSGFEALDPVKGRGDRLCSLLSEALTPNEIANVPTANSSTLPDLAMLTCLLDKGARLSLPRGKYPSGCTYQPWQYLSEAVYSLLKAVDEQLDKLTQSSPDGGRLPARIPELQRWEDVLELVLQHSRPSEPGTSILRHRLAEVRLIIDACRTGDRALRHTIPQAQSESMRLEVPKRARCTGCLAAWRRGAQAKESPRIQLPFRTI